MDGKEEEKRRYTSNKRGAFQKSSENHEEHLKIANLRNAYQSLGDYQKAIEYHEKNLKIAKQIGDGALSLIHI